ncbi:MAG: Mur ligase [Xanthomonadales bacterium]|nr:Mur ligase [Xanthomonadales bacterium]NIX13818.1 Mur ligase [Xanthomonadales bacterium]
MPVLPRLTDSRRLTGANLFWDRPAAIIDIACEGPGASGALKAAVEAWSGATSALLEAVEMPGERLTHRLFDGGASLLISAPVDVLYSMCELNEAAWQAALAILEGGEPADTGADTNRLLDLFEKERNPALLALQAAARDHEVPFLWDDDEVSVGYGKSALVWTPDALPAPDEVDWKSVGTIPVAMVTGTNGKSTTVRMAAAILAAAGLRAGLTSTDWIRVGETILDTGDYSGTGGARTLMRHPDTEVAVLETARGGLLRRGLGIERADAAVITNVAADHLGEWGINTVPELIEAKFIVRRALHGNAPLILNADDDGVVQYAGTLDHAVTWFGLDPAADLVREHLEAGGKTACLQDGWLELRHGDRVRRVIRAEQIPATLDGAARHNVSNALAAMALCDTLGVDEAAIREGLAGFRGDEDDNPGRGNWFRKGDIRILVDFAHNEHGMLALAEMVERVQARRVVLLMGQAGDRLDKDIGDLTRAACRMNPARLMLCELPGYERGRQPMETPNLIRDFAIDSGVNEANIELHGDPADAAALALADARPGDLLVFLALTRREEILRLVHGFLGAD